MPPATRPLRYQTVQLIMLMWGNGTNPSQCGSVAAAVGFARGGWTAVDRYLIRGSEHGRWQAITYVHISS